MIMSCLIVFFVACYNERLQEERVQSEMRVNRILSDLAMLGPLKCMMASAHCVGQKKREEHCSSL